LKTEEKLKYKIYSLQERKLGKAVNTATQCMGSTPKLIYYPIPVPVPGYREDTHTHKDNSTNNHNHVV